MFEENEREINF